jgi:oligopeptide/dipeptide ABC transporter ATP-binding protein
MDEKKAAMAMLLEVQNISRYFPITQGFLFSRLAGLVRAVDGISFGLEKGKTFGLVGESGCGKTTTSRMILLLEEMTGGNILFKGEDIARFSGRSLKKYRGSVQAVFQDPYSSLNPRMRVGKIIAEPVVVNDSLSKEALENKVAHVLSTVGLGPEKAELYPHEFSGGQRQRIAIARSLVLNPDLIVLDEPVSALDVSIRAQIMNLLKELQDRLGMAYLLIAHDLAVVKHMSHTIGVMYLGKMVEVAESDAMHHSPLHPYTRALHAAALPIHPDRRAEEPVLGGEMASPLHPPDGCRFHPRCRYKIKICSEEMPNLVDVGAGHEVACHLIKK